MAAAKNAVEKRLDLLHDQYTEFALSEQARVLRWLVRPDEVRMIETFVETESHERSGSTPDLFFLLRRPFVDPGRHGRLLVEDFVTGYEEVEAQLVEEGFDASWVPPPMHGADDLGSLVRVANSFRAHYQSLVTHLVLVLMPQYLEAPVELWDRWLALLAARCEALELRFVVLDDVAAPRLVELGASPRTWTKAAELDMPAAVEDLAKSDGDLEHPGARFRIKLAQLGEAVGKGELERARQLADAAAKLARNHGWIYLVVPVKFAYAAGLMQAQRPLEAIPVYQEAEAAAAESEAAGDPQGSLLRVHSRLAIGAALIAAGGHRQAAPVYEDCAALATKLEDPLMRLESWRMASYCHEVTQAYDDAWRCGLEGVSLAQTMSAEARQQSTLAYLGEGLLRICAGSSAHRGQEAAIEATMRGLLARPDWRPTEPQNPPYPPSPPAAS